MSRMHNMWQVMVVMSQHQPRPPLALQHSLGSQELLQLQPSQQRAAPSMLPLQP
jgi:hypothetical protein